MKKEYCAYPFGGMYDTTDYRKDGLEPKNKLIPGVTNRWGEPLEGGQYDGG